MGGAPVHSPWLRKTRVFWHCVYSVHVTMLKVTVITQIMMELSNISQKKPDIAITKECHLNIYVYYIKSHIYEMGLNIPWYIFRYLITIIKYLRTANFYNVLAVPHIYWLFYNILYCMHSNSGYTKVNAYLYTIDPPINCVEWYRKSEIFNIYI